MKNFELSKQSDKSHTTVCMNEVAAETAEEAYKISTTLFRTFIDIKK